MSKTHNNKSNEHEINYETNMDTRKFIGPKERDEFEVREH